MPPGAKKRKAAKKKREKQLHVQTASNASPEESGNEREHEHEDDVLTPQTPVQASEGDDKNEAFDVESGSPTSGTGASNREPFAQEHADDKQTLGSFADVKEDYPVTNLEVSAHNPFRISGDGGRDESNLEVASCEGVSDKNVSVHNGAPQWLSESVEGNGSQGGAGQKTTDDLVELASPEGEHESESKHSSVTTYQEVSSGVDSLKPESGVSGVHTEAAEFQEDQGRHDIDDNFTRSRLDCEASTPFKDIRDSTEDTVMPHQELSGDADSLKLDLAVTPVSVVHAESEFQEEQAVHDLDANLAHSEFQEEQAVHDLDANLAHSSLDGEASDPFKDLDGLGRQSVTAHQELSPGADYPKLESGVTPVSLVHSVADEFQQQQGGHDAYDSFVPSKSDGEASDHFENTENFEKDSVRPQELRSDADSPKPEMTVTPVSVLPAGDVAKDSLMPQQELSIDADSLKLDSAAIPVSVVHTEAVEFQRVEGGHKDTEDLGKEVPVQVSGEKDSDMHVDDVVLGKRSSDIIDKFEDTHRTASVSLDATEQDPSVMQEEDPSLGSKVECVSLPKNESTMAFPEPAVCTGKEVSRNDLDTPLAVVEDPQANVNEKDSEVTLHHQNPEDKKSVAIQREAPASWKSCCGMLDFFTGSRY